MQATNIGLRPSVFLKCMAMVAATGLAVATTLTVLGQATLYENAYASLMRLAEDATRNAASANAGAIRFGNVDAVAAFGETLLSGAEGRAVAFAMVDGAGALGVSVGPAADGTDFDILAFGQEAVASGARHVSPDGYWVAEPAIVSDSVVGAIVTGWSAAPDLAIARANTVRALAAAFLVVGVMLALSAWMLRRSVTHPLKAIDDVLETMAVGDYKTPIPHLNRSDEIGSIARSLDDLKEKLATGAEAEAARTKDQQDQQVTVDRISTALRDLADGDLTVSLEGKLGETYAELASDFDRTVLTIIGMIKAVVDSAHAISGQAVEICTSSENLSQRTENQAASLEETAAALDQITSNVRHSAEGTSRVEGVVTSARETARESDGVVQETVDAMSKIEESSDQISQIISVIEDISFQTNLLALNAGVEAARAGEAGRGFAVVASEVRALAQRSSEAAKEITALITQSTHQVSHGVKLVDRTGKELTSIVESVSEVSNLIGDIATRVKDQSVSLEEINTGVTHLDQLTQQNAAMVQQATAAGLGLRESADKLVGYVSVFRLPAQRAAAPGDWAAG